MRSSFLHIPVLLALCAVAAQAQQAPAVTAVATAPPTWSVWIHHPFRPGVLSMCKDAYLKPSFLRDAQPDPADPLKARVLDEAAQIRWSGGTLSQAGAPGTTPNPQLRSPAEPGWRLLTDACFTLFREGQPVVSGAVVHTFSARLLEFPVLVVNRTEPGAPLSMTLLPRFPGDVREPVPPEWRVLSSGR